VLSLQPELQKLNAPEALLLRDRREVFSIYPELRALAWGGVMLIATAAGIWVKNNLDRLGPVVIAILLTLAAAACYAWAWWRRKRQSLVDDYVLLLGALLLSADVAFIENQFHLLGPFWTNHFLILAVLHAVAAYLFDSRMVLSLSLSAFAAWLGLRSGSLNPFNDELQLALRFFTLSVFCIGWREADRRLREKRTFARVFEHYAALAALFGATTLMMDDAKRAPAALMTMAIAAAVIYSGFRQRAESFVLYAFLFAVFAFDVLVVPFLGADALAFLFIVFSVFVAITGLIVLHTRFRKLTS
jgi:hypothetical protein